jgi:hypothetical protein
MDIEDASSLIFQTYYMMNWDTTEQLPSGMNCVNCGKPMLTVPLVRDKKGLEYEGRVCHNCKTLLWVKKD